MDGKKKNRHRAYLLRCWQEGRIATDEERCWRFLVEDVLGQEPQRGFAGLDGLVAFLQAEFAGGGSEEARPQAGASSKEKALGDGSPQTPASDSSPTTGQG